MNKYFCSVMGLLLALTMTEVTTTLAQGQSIGTTLSVPVEPFSIFGPERTVRIPYSKCSSDSARHGVRVKKGSNGREYIHWQWDNKRSSWCGWGIQDIPNKDLAPYVKDFSLEVRLRGSWSDRDPEIKFMDKDNKSTKLVRITPFLHGDPSSENGTLVKIPLTAFDMDWSIDIKNVHTLQFDAAYESANGEIKIDSIAISR